MAEITASMVKTLREQTSVGMMDCKSALVEAKGDIKRAGELLREKGAAKAVKRAARAKTEGLIRALVSDDACSGSIVEVNTETDFSARNERFGALVDTVNSTALAAMSSSVEELVAAKPVGADAGTVQDLIVDLIAVVGENMGVGRCASLQVPNGEAGLIHAYIHPPGKVGVMIRLACDTAEVASAKQTDEMAHELCLQIAFSAPTGIDQASIPQDVIDSEREVYRNAAIKEGKPEKILDKIVDGRLRSFFKERCLLEQPYVKDDKQTVGALIAETGKAVGGSITVAELVRFQLGEAGEADAEE